MFPSKQSTSTSTKPPKARIDNPCKRKPILLASAMKARVKPIQNPHLKQTPSKTKPCSPKSQGSLCSQVMVRSANQNQPPKTNHTTNQNQHQINLFQTSINHHSAYQALNKPPPKSILHTTKNNHYAPNALQTKTIKY